MRLLRAAAECASTSLIQVNGARLLCNIVMLTEASTEVMMSETVSQNRPVFHEAPASEKSGGPNAQAIVIGILVLVAAVLLAWQFAGCASCYAPT